ncbi:MAG TPA: SufS family cysteine desulfurase [Solirubrobacteraceae bacterium]|nr:SufS family cysteine desulfurase [Solirubrobacteraceae bacterium]
MPRLADSALDVRADFPIFATRPGDRPLHYLDSASTSQKPRVVLDALDRHLREHNANVHRGVYPLAEEADEAFEGARRTIAAFTGAERRGTIFTKNVTEAINLVSYAWGRRELGPGDAVLITELEHHANIVPWQQACAATGAQLRYLRIDEHGELSLEQLDAELERGDVRLVAFAHMSNVLGTINPAREFCARARDAGALTLIDGAQAVPQLAVDVSQIGADFYAWTGHKALGPTGIGVLHARGELLERMEPFLTGGDMISSVTLTGATWNELPWKFEAGTPPIAEAVGLGAAAGYLESLTMERVRAHEQALTAELLDALAAVPGLTILGPPDATARGALAAFTIDGIHPHDIAELLGRDGVCIRAGHHCAQPLMRTLGIGASARASLGVYSTSAEIEALSDSLRRARELFGLDD